MRTLKDTVDTVSMLYAALENLIDVTQIIKKQHQQELIGDIVWLRDFCTIRLQAARRSGHDSCIRKMIEENSDKQFMIVHPTIHQSRYFKDNNRSFSNYRLATAYSIEDFRGIPDINYIIVNTASCVKEQDLNKIYSFATGYITKNPDFLIIMIG